MYFGGSEAKLDLLQQKLIIHEFSDKHLLSFLEEMKTRHMTHQLVDMELPLAITNSRQH